MSREILDCLKRERDICVKNVIHSQNTAFMFTPALRGLYTIFKKWSLNTSAISRCIKRRETKIWILVDIFMKYTFLSFLMLWRHRSRDQNGPKFNIRSKSLLEPFSKNIFNRSCSLINRVLNIGTQSVQELFFCEHL